MSTATFMLRPIRRRIAAVLQLRRMLQCAVMTLVVSGSASAGTDAVRLHQTSGPLLHTFVEMKAYGDNQTAAVLDRAFAEMGRINDLLNNYDPSSEISAINAAAGSHPVTISAETFDALNEAKKYARLSNGAFDFTIGPLVSLWGFDRDTPGLAGNEPNTRQVKQAVRLVDYSALMLDENQSGPNARLKHRGMYIDVGAFGKGFAADSTLAFLRENGISNALVAAGGTICASGSKPGNQPWQIGIRHPRNDTTFLTVIALHDQCVSTSGDYEKFYYTAGRRRSHIIDPRTGHPVASVQSVTVIAPSGIASDSLATALFVMGPVDGISLIERLSGCEALIVTAEGKIVFSKEWPQKTIIY